MLSHSKDAQKKRKQELKKCFMVAIYVDSRVGCMHIKIFVGVVKTNFSTGRDIHVPGREHTSYTGHVKCYVHVVSARVPSLRSETVWKHIK